MIVVGAGLRGTIRDICKRCASSHTLGNKPPPMIKRNVTRANPTRHMRSAIAIADAVTDCAAAGCFCLLPCCLLLR